MAMKCLALFLLVIQVEGVSSCIFDKVEELRGVSKDYIISLARNDCFAKCYTDRGCIALAYDDKEGLNVGQCTFHRSGNKTYNCPNDIMCYILQRDDIDLTCQTYLNV